METQHSLEGQVLTTMDAEVRSMHTATDCKCESCMVAIHTKWYGSSCRSARLMEPRDS